MTMKVAIIAALLAASAAASPVPTPASDNAATTTAPPVDTTEASTPLGYSATDAPLMPSVRPSDIPPGIPDCLIGCANEANTASGCKDISDWDCNCRSEAFSKASLWCVVRACPNEIGSGFAWHASHCYRNSPPPGSDILSALGPGAHAASLYAAMSVAVGGGAFGGPISFSMAPTSTPEGGQTAPPSAASTSSPASAAAPAFGPIAATLGASIVAAVAAAALVLH